MTIHLGVDWTESHRYDRAREFWKPYTLRAPLCERPYIEKDDILKALDSACIAPPRLYKLGFPHNNCGGFCVKTGQTQFKLLLNKLPDRYAWHEAQEQEAHKHVGSSHGFIRKTVDGKLNYLSMLQFRESIQEGCIVPTDEVGGCGCFNDMGDDEGVV